MIKKVFNRVLGLLYPTRARCLGCGDMTGNQHEDFLCDRCREKMDRLFDLYEAGGADMPGVRRAFAAYPYVPPVKGVIHAFKFSSLPTLAEPLADDLCRLLVTHELTDYDCAAPVPLHRKREYQRGYNQSLLLAEAIAEELKIPVFTDLKRIRSTKQQAMLSTAERRKNLQNAFECKKPLPGPRVLLVDDVLTTGSTAASCAQALLAGGAAFVDVCTIAMAGKHRPRPAAK